MAFFLVLLPTKRFWLSTNTCKQSSFFKNFFFFCLHPKLFFKGETSLFSSITSKFWFLNYHIFADEKNFLYFSWNSGFSHETLEGGRKGFSFSCWMKENMGMEIVISVTLLWVGIAVLVIIHVCLVSRACSRNTTTNGVGGAVVHRNDRRSPSMSEDEIKK